MCAGRPRRPRVQAEPAGSAVTVGSGHPAGPGRTGAAACRGRAPVRRGLPGATGKPPTPSRGDRYQAWPAGRCWPGSRRSVRRPAAGVAGLVPVPPTTAMRASYERPGSVATLTSRRRTRTRVAVRVPRRLWQRRPSAQSWTIRSGAMGCDERVLVRAGRYRGQLTFGAAACWSCYPGSGPSACSRSAWFRSAKASSSASGASSTAMIRLSAEGWARSSSSSLRWVADCWRAWVC